MSFGRPGVLCRGEVSTLLTPSPSLRPSRSFSIYLNGLPRRQGDVYVRVLFTFVCLCVFVRAVTSVVVISIIGFSSSFDLQ